MTSTNPSKSFQNVCDAKIILQHYEILKVTDALDFVEALENFGVLYKKGLAKGMPSQLAKFCDVLVGNSKMQAALSKLIDGVAAKPLKLVTTGMDVQAQSGLAIQQLVQSDVLNNAMLRANVMARTNGSTREMQATLRMSRVFIDDESSTKLMDLLKTAPGILGTTKAFTKAL